MANSLRQQQAVGCPLLLVYMTLGIINPSGKAGVDSGGASSAAAPLPLRVLKDLSPIRWGIESILISEMEDLKIEGSSWKNLPRMGAFSLIKDGNQVLDALGITDDDDKKINKKLHRRGVKKLLYVTAIKFVAAVVGLSLTSPTTKFGTNNNNSNDNSITF